MQILKVSITLIKFSDIELSLDVNNALCLSQDSDKVYVHKDDLAALVEALEALK